MNVKQLIAAVTVLAAAGSVFAADVTPFAEQENFVSTKTRAEVVAELVQARANGELVAGDTYAGNTSVTTSTRSRDEVRAEAIKAAKNQKLSADYDFGA